MNALEAALADLAGYLERSKIPYMVIGGIANLYWGRARLTEDLDVTASVEEANLPAFVAALARDYQLLADEPLEFARRTRVIPLRTPAGVRVDVILAGIAFEEAAILRAVPIEVAGVRARFATAEDIILHKLASERPRDHEDVEGIIHRQGARLDRSYLDPLVDDLARSLERPALVEFYRRALAGPRTES